MVDSAKLDIQQALTDKPLPPPLDLNREPFLLWSILALGISLKVSLLHSQSKVIFGMLTAREQLTIISEAPSVLIISLSSFLQDL